MNRHPRTNSAWILLALLLLLLATAAATLVLGSTRLSATEVLATLVGRGDEMQNIIILQMRLPRLALAILLGAGLATAGAVMQGIARNDLASPDTLGVNAGSGLGLMFLLLVFPTAVARSPLLMPLGAMAGAMGIVAVVFALAYRQGSVLPARLLLVGIALGFAAHAAMFFLAFRMSFSTYNYALSWMSGNLSGNDWKTIFFLLPWPLVLIPLLCSRARILDVLSLGDYLAKGLGVAVERERLMLMTTAVILTAACTSIGGHIGFLGLIAPHIARRVAGRHYSVLLPAAALIGAILLLLADGLARQLFTPVEMPAGVLVSVLGGVYFLYLLATTKG
jgi:iron complex transport system permease protein